MTTVVSRLYDTVDTANRVADRLRAAGFPEHTLSVIATADLPALDAARVSAPVAASYAAAMTGGQAVLVCRAPVTPFGAARVAMATADGEPWIDTGRGAANDYIREVADLDGLNPSVLTNHPLMMTRDDYVGSGWSGWRLSDVFGFPTISSRRDYRPSVLTGTRYMSRAFWPQRLLTATPRRSSVFAGGRRFLGSGRSVSSPQKRSVLTSHPRITEAFGFKTLSGKR